LLLTCAVCCLVVFAASSQQEDKPAIDPETYNALMAAQVFSAGDLQNFYLAQREGYIAILPPDIDFILRQSGAPEILPFDPAAFPSEFTDALVPVYENSVPVYPLTIAEDFATRETYFLNADGKEVYALPAVEDYNPYAFLEERYPDLFPTAYDSELTDYLKALYDPARIEIQVKMIAAEDVEPYLYAQAQIAEAAAQMQMYSEGGGGMMLLDEDETNHLWLSIQGPAQGLTNVEIQAHIPAGFTNAIEMFTGTNLLSFWWTLAATNLVTEGTDTVYWTYEFTEDMGPVFFAAGKAGVDSDNDGLTDAREKFLYHTDPNNADTDGDGFGDCDEIFVYGTDPLDKYSVPPLNMLSVSGKDIVDESTNPVVIKSVNIGAWLQWEQWMLMFKPHLWTNDWGRVYGLKSLGSDDETDEQTAKEILADNVDAGAAVTLRATQCNASNRVQLQNWYQIGNDNVTFMGDFTNTSWLCFSNVNFGAGFSNLAVGLAVPQENAGHRIEMHLDNPTGTVVGVVTTRVTGGWSDFTEQYLSGFSISGTQTIYFVGSATSGVGIANLYRFRFFADAPNTTNLVETFRNNYFTTNDLDRIKALGYNCIRLPFFYTILEDDFAPYQYKETGWNRLDWAVNECAKRRLWVILDMHSTPGSQNPYHSGGFADPFKNRLWKLDEYKDRTAALWVEIARRYSNNPTVAGYDLFNEPSPPRSGETHNDYRVAFSNYVIPMVTKLHSAIRSNDTRHVLLIENNFMYTNSWDDMFSCPNPASQGWTGVVYQFHVYDQTVYGHNTNDDWWFSTQKGICDNMIRTFTRLSDARQVPVYLGEFAPWDERNTEYWIRQCEANKVSWGHWNFRSWGWDDTNNPTKGRTIWGLDYRSAETTNAMPDLKADTLSTLADDMAEYSSTNYVANEILQEVVENHTLATNPASERTEFYLNTFDCANVTNLSDWKALPWKKLAAAGPENKFRVQSSRADLLLDGGPLLMRLKSRDEADARFEVNDSEGTKFSADVTAINAPGDVAGADAEIRLSALRDEITSPVKAYDTVGVVARLIYDVVSNSVTFYLDAKNGGTNTFGTELYQSAAMGFVANGTLMLSVNQTNASIAYNGTNLWKGTHGLDLAAWPNGAVAAVEAERMSGSSVTNAVMDNFKAWRETARVGVGVTNTFTAYPDGITLLTEPEQLTIRECYAKSWKSESFVTNGEALWIPEETTYGGSWFNPRLDYQNDVRLNVPVTNILELRVTYEQFRSTNFLAKICFMPEFFPGEYYWLSSATFPCLQVKYRETGAHAGNLAFDIWRHTAPGTDEWVYVNDSYAFTPGQVISYQLSTNTCRVYYGTNLLISYPHGVNITNTYRVGSFPHLEFQNKAESTNVAAWVGSVSCRQLPTWTVPEP